MALRQPLTAADRFRGTAAWKRARKIALRGATHCGICGGWLDFNAPSGSKWAPSVDHVLPLSGLDLGTHEGRMMATNQAWLQVTHLGCNARRGARHRASRDFWTTRPQTAPLLESPANRIPQVWSVAEAVERLRGTGEDEFAGIDEPLQV